MKKFSVKVLFMLGIAGLLLSPDAEAEGESCFFHVLESMVAAKDKLVRAHPQTYHWVQKGLFWVGIPVGGYKVLEITNYTKKSDPKWPQNYAYSRHGKVRLSSKQLGEHLAQEIESKHIPIDDLQHIYPDLMDYLAGSTRVDYNTGSEEALKEWVLSQPENSITPEKIYSASLSLNKGAGISLLCAHQLLRNEARYGADYIRYSSTPEERTKFFNKFKDIRGDLVEAGGDADHAGSWYRLFGMLTKVYADGVREGAEEPHSAAFGNLKINFSEEMATATIAEGVKPVIRWHERDNGKATFNRFAVSTGYHLLSSLKSEK